MGDVTVYRAREISLLMMAVASLDLGRNCGSYQNMWPGGSVNMVLFLDASDIIVLFIHSIQYCPLFPYLSRNECCICKGALDTYIMERWSAAYRHSEYKLNMFFSLMAVLEDTKRAHTFVFFRVRFSLLAQFFSSSGLFISRCCDGCIQWIVASCV